MHLNEHRRDGRESSGSKHQKFHKKIKFWNTHSSKQRLSVWSRNMLEWQQTNRSSFIPYQRMASESTSISVIMCKKNVNKMCLKTALFSVVRPRLIWMAKLKSVKFASDMKKIINGTTERMRDSSKANVFCVISENHLHGPFLFDGKVIEDVYLEILQTGSWWAHSKWKRAIHFSIGQGYPSHPGLPGWPFLGKFQKFGFVWSWLAKNFIWLFGLFWPHHTLVGLNN